MKTNYKLITRLLILLILIPFTLTWLTGAPEQPQNVEELYRNAKQSIYSKDWKAAAKTLQQLINNSPDNRFTDDSLYWLAYSMNRLSRDIESLDGVLETQKKALRHLEILISRYPDSKFKDDARALKVEIAEELVRKGFKEYKSYIVNGAASDDNLEIKLLAIESLMNMDPEKAFPILEKIVRTGKSSRLRERAIFVLSQNLNAADGRVQKILTDLALNDKDIKIREKAIFWLGQIHSTKILDQLMDIYYGLAGSDENILKLKEKVIFSVSQFDPDKSVKILIKLYQKEKSLRLKKKILFWLGQSKNAEAASFIQKILLEKP